jgi:hypothetical protein
MPSAFAPRSSRCWPVAALNPVEVCAPLARWWTCSSATVTPEAALRLEELWETLVAERQISLLCAYCSGNFRELGDSHSFADVCNRHTYVIPSEGFAGLADSQARLREISVLQQRARVLEGEIRQRKAIESALREVLERRTHVEAELRASLEREQAARVRASGQ